MITLGLDVGGTKIECAAVKWLSESCDKYEILSRKRIPTQRHGGYQLIVEKTCALIHEVCEESSASLKDIQGIGMGMPGSVNREGLMVNGNSMVFTNMPFARDLKKGLGVSFDIVIQNDANCFAMAEVLLGRGREFETEFSVAAEKQTAIGIILGTGVGGGIVVNGEILYGKQGGGGEIGHTKLVSNGHPCYCGRSGCAEQYLSGPGIEAEFASRIYSQIDKRPNALEIFELYRKKDPIAQAIFLQYKQLLAKFLVNLSNIFDPHYFVLGGGMSKESELYEGLETDVLRDCFLKQGQTKIYPHKLGDSAGVLGAAILPLR